MKKTRAPDLNEERIQAVLDTLDNWKGKLTWELLLVAVKEKIGIKYSRFTFSEYPDIANAFAFKKEKLRSGIDIGDKAKPTVRDEKVRAAMDALERFKAKNERLEKENMLLKEQFVTWAHNAERKGISMMMLNAAIPKPYREQSKLKK